MTLDQIEAHRNTEMAAGSDRKTTASAVNLNGELTAKAGSEVSRKITAALEQLPLNERTALFLRDVQKLPLGAVANQLGCSIPKARLHIANGRVLVLRCLQR